ncbi:MAG: hypothetical protein GY822_05380 [Deltaproteobacteria bacterium]|nr:hypothetical protein [Deltaproteobacteria bacterium]
MQKRNAKRMSFYDLKKVEVAAFRKMFIGNRLRKATVSRMAQLIEHCSALPDVDEAICYHGALALLFEHRYAWTEAILHRRLEIKGIEKLHALAAQNEGDRIALKGYEEGDLEERRVVLARLLQASAS